MLPPLPYPVYFVCKNTAVWGDVIAGSTEAKLEQLHVRFRDANDSWSTQPYLQLKQRGLDVHLVPRPVEGQICIVTYEDLAIKDFPFQSYIVACRHDRGRPEICEQRIVQNLLNVVDGSDFYLPHWPQPSIQPRDSSRGSRVENIAYKGRQINLARPFKTSDFTEQIHQLGLKLSVSPDDEAERVRDSANYREVDVILAVRDCTEYNLTLKPPSKLVNAWFAECPALLGPEPAFQVLRRSELDYMEIRSQDEAIDALRRLRESPDLYRAMVENGKQRAREFTADRIAEQWRDLLASEIARGYEQWLAQSRLEKSIGRPLRFLWRAYKHKQERASFFKNIHHGPRLFS